MRNKIIWTIVAFVVVFLIASNVFAYDPVDNNGEISLFEAYNHLTGTSYSDNTSLNYVQLNPDEFFTNHNGSFIPISGSAGFNNTVSTHDVGNYSSQQAVFYQPSTFGYLGDGTNLSPYNLHTIPTSTNFTTLITTEHSGDSEIYSSNTAANLGARDHFVVYQVPELVGQSVFVNDGNNVVSHTLTNPYLVGWEDLDLGDQDYNDVVYLMDGTTPYNPNLQTQITNVNNTNINQQNQINNIVGATNTNALNSINQAHQLNDVEHRVNILEKMDVKAVGKIRVFDTKKWEGEVYAEWSKNQRNVNEIGFELTYKFGKSYTENRMDELEKKINKLTGEKEKAEKVSNSEAYTTSNGMGFRDRF